MDVSPSIQLRYGPRNREGYRFMARRFRFNLDAVLRYREIMEDERRREYLEAKKLVDEERVKQEELQQERSAVLDEIVQALEREVSVQSVMASYSTIGRLDAAVAESRQREKQLEDEVEKRRLAMIGAHQETSIMENLKERRREEFLREQDKIEQALLDDLSIQAQGRRVREAREQAVLDEARLRERLAREAGLDAGGEMVL